MDERSTQEPTAQRPASRWSGAWLAGWIVMAFAVAALVSRCCASLLLTEWSLAALMLLAMLVILDWIAAGLGCLVRRYPTPGRWRRLLGATIGLSLVLALGNPGRHGFNERRTLEMLVSRIDPLVRAIESFQRERGRAPQSLEDLSPEFISKIPQVQVLGQVVRPSYTRAEPWSLRVDLRLGSWIGYPTGELE